MSRSGLEIKVTSAGLIVNDKKKLRKLFRQVGGEVLSAARKLLRKASGGGRVYRGGGGGQYRGGYKPGHFTASSPGQPPATITGTLGRSLAVRPFRSGEGVAVRARVFYALFLEAGAKGGGKGKRSRSRRGKPATARVLLARPFLTMALSTRSASLSERVKAALMQDVTFKRIKA